MNRRLSVLILGAGMLIAASTLDAGGWAVITVDDLPDRLVASQPFDLTFTVRQHGARPIPGLSPKIQATAGDQEIAADARGTGRAGQYAASLTLPRAAEWTITIHSGFGASRLTLMPLKVSASSEQAVAMPEALRGQHLFVAKGCVTCHGRETGTPNVSVRQGPELVPNKYQAEFLARVLTDPSARPRQAQFPSPMPDLGLRAHEIPALVAFINSPRAVAAR